MEQSRQSTFAGDRGVDLFRVEIIRGVDGVPCLALLFFRGRNRSRREELARRVHGRLRLACGRLLPLGHGGLQDLALAVGGGSVQC